LAALSTQVRVHPVRYHSTRGLLRRPPQRDEQSAWRRFVTRRSLGVSDPQEAFMLAVQRPDDIEQRLDALAKGTGRSNESYLQAAIVEYLGDLEDFHLAEQRLADIGAGRAVTVSLAEVERGLGLED
jgi:RHH-type rel operon transcriptional repressor/antitoxin RelB